MITIIGGEFRSRRLLGPRDETVSRPYAQRVKEAVFNLLREWFEGARVLDLFAGIGTMGLEAVSRGARTVVMVERDKAIFRLLKENVERLGCGDRATAIHGDALGATALLRAPAPVDVLFVDPPYAMMRDEPQRRRVLDQIVRARECLARRSFVVLRSPIGGRDGGLLVPGFEGPEEHRYGREMHVLLYCPLPDADGECRGGGGDRGHDDGRDGGGAVPRGGGVGGMRA